MQVLGRLLICVMIEVRSAVRLVRFRYAHCSGHIFMDIWQIKKLTIWSKLTRLNLHNCRPIGTKHLPTCAYISYHVKTQSRVPWWKITLSTFYPSPVKKTNTSKLWVTAGHPQEETLRLRALPLYIGPTITITKDYEHIIWSHRCMDCHIDNFTTILFSRNTVMINIKINIKWI